MYTWRTKDAMRKWTQQGWEERTEIPGGFPWVMA